MPHEKGISGYPLDPELDRLQSRLGELAGMWRSANRRDEKESKEEIVQEYHAIMAQLYQLGWEDELDYDAILPYELMPEEYRREYLPWDPWGTIWPDNPDRQKLTKKSSSEKEQQRKSIFQQLLELFKF